MSKSLLPHIWQHVSVPCPSLDPGVCLNSYPLSWWCYPAILSSVAPFFLFSVFPSIMVFSNKSALHIRGSKYWSFSFSISPFSDYTGLISFRIDWFDSPSCPRDSQESSPTPQFKSTNSLALSFLYSPTLTPIHDYWENHSFDYMDFVGKVISWFLIHCLGLP